VTGNPYTVPRAPAADTGNEQLRPISVHLVRDMQTASGELLGLPAGGWNPSLGGRYARRASRCFSDPQLLSKTFYMAISRRRQARGGRCTHSCCTYIRTLIMAASSL